MTDSSELNTDDLVEEFRLKAFLVICALGVVGFVAAISVYFVGARDNLARVITSFVMLFFFGVSIFIGRAYKIYRPMVLSLLYLTFVALIIIIFASPAGAAASGFNYFYVLVVSSGFFLGLWHSILFVVLSVMFITTFIFNLYSYFGVKLPDSFFSYDLALYTDRIVSLVILGVLSYSFVRLNNIFHTNARKIRELEDSKKKIKMLKVLFGGFAHEINNPLAIASASGELITMISKDDKIKELSSRVVHSVSRASGIIRRLLAFDGEGVSAVTPVNLSLLVQEIINENKSYYKRYNIQLKIPRKTIVKSNETALKEIILNLILNAIEASSIEDNEIEISFDTGNRSILVFNKGTPIGQEFSKEATMLFKTTKMDRPGRGIGLFSVEMLCEQLNHSFSIAPVEEGTVAAVRLDDAVHFKDPR